MTDHNSQKANRKQRRKDAARCRKGGQSGARPPRTAWSDGPAPTAQANLDLELLKSVGDHATSAALYVVRRHFDLVGHDLNRCYVPIDDVMSGKQASCAVAACTVLIHFAAQALLHMKGVESRVVAGAAMWSVGPGAINTLDHGILQNYGRRRDVASGNYHTWLDIHGNLYDFGARFLPQKLEDAHSVQPFTTPRARWRRFPETIIHRAGAPMGDPITNRHSSYAYAEGFPCLLHELRLQLAPMLRDLQVSLDQICTS